MTKQKFTFFLSAMVGVCMLAMVATGCNDEKKSSTETTTTDEVTTPATSVDTMTVPADTMKMDTATTRPIVPGT